MPSEPSLVDLPDEILLQVMSYLTTSDLLLLARTCRRLCALLSDRSLWCDVDLRQSRLRARQLARLLRHLHAETRRVCLAGHVSRGRPRRQPLLTARCLNNIKSRCESLVELRLERCLLNAREMPLDLLPDSLLCLSLRNSEVTHRPAGRSYFYRLWELTPRLVELDLSGCGWLNSHALLPLSKLAQLRRLVLRDCARLGGELAYSSIACMLGFRALEALDVCRTQVSDSDVNGFCQLPQLSELLLEPRRRGLLDGDTALRQLGQHRGRQLRRLALRGCPLRNQSVSQLPQLLPELRQLDLTRADVPAERRRWLSAQLPRCVVSCHESKPVLKRSPSPEPGRDVHARPGQRRRRSRSPTEAADGAPPGKRSRHQHCQCIRCTDGEEDMDDVQEEDDPEHDEQDPVDLENRPGVIVVNLGQLLQVRNGLARDLGGELGGRDGDAEAGGRVVEDAAPVGAGDVAVVEGEAVEGQRAEAAQGDREPPAEDGPGRLDDERAAVLPAAEGVPAARDVPEASPGPTDAREEPADDGHVNNNPPAQAEASGADSDRGDSSTGQGQVRDQPGRSGSGDGHSEETPAAGGRRPDRKTER